jgi:hypothetical protein
MVSLSFLDTNLFSRIFLSICRMKVSDIIFLENDTYKLEEGCGRRVLSKGEIAVLKFGGTETAVISKKFKEGAELL